MPYVNNPTSDVPSDEPVGNFSSVSNLVENLRKFPLLRPNKYEVKIGFPSGNPSDMPEGLAAGSDDFNCWADSITLPGRSLATVERRTFGPQREMPYERLFSGDLEVTFVLQKGAYWRHKMEEWMDLVIDPTTNKLNPERSTYLGTLQIDLLDEDNTAGYTIIAEEVFPKTISPISLAYSQENDYLRQTVSFAFRNYSESNTTDQPSQTGQPMPLMAGNNWGGNMNPSGIQPVTPLY